MKETVDMRKLEAIFFYLVTNEYFWKLNIFLLGGLAPLSCTKSSFWRVFYWLESPTCPCVDANLFFIISGYVFMHDKRGRCRIILHIFVLYSALCVFLFLISYKYLNFKIKPVTESLMYTFNKHSFRTFSGQLKWCRI
jgi:surface polysaccharide O-acyltransferase-like enzyme